MTTNPSLSQSLPRKEYGANIAVENAYKREQEVLNVLESSNKLTLYGPWLCLFSLTTFTIWCMYWTLFDTPLSSSSVEFCKLNDKTTSCPTSFFSYVSNSTSIDFDENLYRTISYLTSGVFISSFLNQAMQLTDNEIKQSFRLTPIYCTAVINIIAFFAHFSMARGWFPVKISAFGRINHVARWGEWISLVPLLMVMMNSIDIRNDRDFRLLWEAALLQLISVILGGLASFITDPYIAVPFMIISILSYMHIFYVLFRALNRYNNLRSAILKKLNSSDTINYSTLKKSSLHSNSNSKSKDLSDQSTREIVDQVGNVTATMSVKLAIFCTLTWTLKVLVYGIGALHLITQTQEAIIQSLMDCVSKSIYARVLCASHGIAMSPEGVLGRMLLMEEQANASIRQFLRFVYHEISTPLNTVSMCVHNLTDESLSTDGKEMVHMAKESCLTINETLTDLLNFQEVEEGGLAIHTQPINFKALIRSVAGQYITAAKEKGVILLLAVDPRIPDIVLGEKVRLRQVLAILISNGVSFAQEKGGTCAIMAELKNNITVDGSFAHVRVAIRDDGPGFNEAEVESLFRAYAHLTAGSSDMSRGSGMGLCVAKQIIELHGGTLNVDTALSRGSTFYFDINFAFPSTRNDSDTYMMAEVLSNNTDTIGIGRSPFNVSPKQDNDSNSSNVVSNSNNNTNVSQSQPSSQGLFSGQPINFETFNKSRSPASLEPISTMSGKVDMTSSGSMDSLPGTASSTPTSKVRTVALVVDDVLMNRKLLKKTLERIGLVVDDCEDGDILVDKICKDHKQYDVIFLDNMMPRLRGVDAVRILRAENYRGLIIGVTGNVLKEDIVEFLNAGCDDVLTKPVTVEMIKEALKPHGVDLAQ